MDNKQLLDEELDKVSGGAESNPTSNSNNKFRNKPKEMQINTEPLSLMGLEDTIHDLTGRLDPLEHI